MCEHDNFQRFGITIYKLIYACLLKFLLPDFYQIEFFDLIIKLPHQIADYYLPQSSKANGIPLKLITECGSDNFEINKKQILLSSKHGQIFHEESINQQIDPNKELIYNNCIGFRY
ncbi:hypothetical protein VP01_889g4 [Puccinia sorghi]|uniref:Uncharacterized protein n=1 Tax=Puccinia sorghi TaxID=27349 RepID=A0A0L6U841_9BASI|nr:hypothetical protein VP01_889g4 [Puccinia sorghi]